MKRMIVLGILAAVAMLALPAPAQHLTGTFTTGVTAGSVCASGTTTSCEVGTGIYDNTSASTFTSANLLCTAAGTAATFTCPITAAAWPVFTSHTITAQTEYYGATAGQLLTTTAVATGSGGNQISVENLLILAPTGVSANVTAKLMTTGDRRKGWLVWTPDQTETPTLDATIAG
jgi:hypothetical protein